MNQQRVGQSYDDKVDAIVYEYAAENGENVDQARAHERYRGREANRFLKTPAAAPSEYRAVRRASTSGSRLGERRAV